MKKSVEISQIRFKYKENPLTIKSSERNPFLQFNKWMNEAIKNKVFEPTAMALATINNKNQQVSNRIVLLKDVEKNCFVFYTNLNSKKSKEINDNKKVAAVFWWPQIGKQVRIEGKVSNVSDNAADKYFATRSRKSQIGSWASTQSSKLNSRNTLIEKTKIIENRFANKPVPRPKFWSGFKIKPNWIEFWQGRESRLHDRIIYKKTGKKWKKFLLNP